METKVCPKCKQEKLHSEFYKDKSTKHGIRAFCKECDKKRYKKLKLKDKVNVKEKRCSKCGQIKLMSEFCKYIASIDGYQHHCRECNHKYNIQNSDKMSEYNKSRKLAPKISIEGKVCTFCGKYKLASEYYNDSITKDGIKTICKACDSIRKKKYRPNEQKRRKERLKDDPLFRLVINTRTLIRNSIKRMGYDKKSKTYKILGCSWEFFMSYIEKLFEEGMTWGNYGEWHLDHIIPVSWAKTEEDIYILNYYTNFQPLWKHDNLSKGNRYCE